MELTDGTISLSGNDYRLQNVVDIQKQLELERAKRGRLSTNYNNSLKVVIAAEGILAVSFMGVKYRKRCISVYGCCSCSSNGNRSCITWSRFTLYYRWFC